MYRRSAALSAAAGRIGESPRCSDRRYERLSYGIPHCVPTGARRPRVRRCTTVLVPTITFAAAFRDPRARSPTIRSASPRRRGQRSGPNQGLLLAGGVAYYTLLSIVPLMILLVIILSHVIEADRLMATLAHYLEIVVPGQSGPLIEELRGFIAHREVIGWTLAVTLIFFSSLAFSVLENAMSVIFYHRVLDERAADDGVAADPVPVHPDTGHRAAGRHARRRRAAVVRDDDARFASVTTGRCRRLSRVLLYMIGVCGEVLVLPRSTS